MAILRQKLSLFRNTRTKRNPCENCDLHFSCISSKIVLQNLEGFFKTLRCVFDIFGKGMHTICAEMSRKLCASSFCFAKNSLIELPARAGEKMVFENLKFLKNHFSQGRNYVFGMWHRGFAECRKVHNFFGTHGGASCGGKFSVLHD